MDLTNQKATQQNILPKGNGKISKTFSRSRFLTFVIPLITVLLLFACQSSSEPTPAQTAELAQQTETATEASVADEIGDSEPVTDTRDSDAATTEDAAPEIATENSGHPPVRMTIPAIDFAAQVEPMAWRVTEVEGQRQAVWEVPEEGVGWHINSATPGAAGNMIFSGHHLSGAAVFAPLTRGEVVLDDQILVTDADGQTFVYQVTEIAAPIPVSGATAEEVNQINAYYTPSQQAKLTLITGWPDFSDTHYLFIIADFVGELE